MVHIRHNLIIECKPKIVYEAITTEKGIQGWWTDDVIIEPKIGNEAEFNFGDRYHNRMKITDLLPERRIAWYCLEGDEEWVGTDFIFELEEKKGRTILRFCHNNWRESTDFYASCNFFWGQYMVSLKNYCETGRGNPFISIDK